MKKYWKVTTFIMFLVLIFSFITCKKGKLNDSINIKKTSIEVVESEFDFGRINMNDTIRHTFKVKNTSTNALVIKDVQAQCECTITGFEKKPVKNGDFTKISIAFTPEKIGVVKKHVVIEANTSPPYTILTINGIVE